MLLLRHGCPAHLRVLTAPFQVTLAEDTGVQPDLLIAPRSAFSERDLPGPPLLAVEIMSPSTRLLALELRDGLYVEVADVGDDEEWTATSPFPITIQPGLLVD